MKERRLKILWISPEFVMDFLNGKTQRYTITGVPKGAVPRNVFYDAARNCFGIVVEHKSFDPVPEVAVIPDLDVVLKVKPSGVKSLIRWW